MKKIPQKSKKKQEIKMKRVAKPKKEKVVIVAQEIKFARLLSDNEKKSRDRSLKMLKKWLLNCFDTGYDFKDDDFLRIWKGLFYAVWMADKPLIQEELCDNIAGILDLFPPEQYRHALSMARVGLQALATEWYGIDHHRMDKCLMLVRRYLRGSLRCVARMDWSELACKMYVKMISGSGGILSPKTPFYARNATSMVLHVVDCFLEEVAKVSEGKIPRASLAILLGPFCSYMCNGSSVIVSAACRRLLTALLRQSELGQAYADKTRAWERMGCPGSGPDALELASDDEDDGENDDDNEDEESTSRPKALDPRAGRVNVELPILEVPSEEISNMLAELIAHTGSKAHKRAKICMQRFQQLSQQQYPLRVQTTPIESVRLPHAAVAARSLHALDKKLRENTDELALRGLSRKHRKRLLAKSRAGMSIVEEATALTASHNNAAGDWQVEDTAPPPAKKMKIDSSNKENETKKQEKRNREKQNGAQHTSKNKINKNKIKPQDSAISEQNKLNKNDKKSLKELKKSLKEEKKVTETPVKKPVQTDKAEPVITKKAGVAKNFKNVKNFQKQLSPKVEKNLSFDTPKKVKFVLKNNSEQGAIDYYKSVRKSPNIPFDSSKKPSKTNLKVSSPSPINPFFKKKWKIMKSS